MEDNNTDKRASEAEATLADQQANKRIKVDACKSTPNPSHDFKNEYQGYTFSEEATAAASPPSIDRIHMADLTAESFYRDYVAKRKPCVILGNLNDSKWRVSEKWTSTKYLKEKAGNVEIAVEKRSNAKDKFGQGNEIKLKFADFLDLLDAGEESYYLTTQDVKTVADGRPDVMSSFMQCLSEDFPVRPKLAGNLIPQNINVWMGYSKDGSSSGLHHDYHDNLYTIIRGVKTFDLYAPSDAIHLYTRGQLKKIHKNGRINYVGEETNADGSHAQAEKALDASLRQEEAVKELEAAETAVERGEVGAKERLARAEKLLDEAMEAVMDAESDNDERADGDDQFDDFHDDDIDDDDEQTEDFWEAAERKKMELLKETTEGNAPTPDGKDIGQKVSEKTRRDNGGDALDEGIGTIDDVAFEGEGRIVDQTIKDPLNFSLVDTTLDAKDAAMKFPSFARSVKSTVEISFGEMLYLPASWFHEVTSKGGHHLAFNYWFHPPDGDSFERPYSRPFWPKDWKLRNLSD